MSSSAEALHPLPETDLDRVARLFGTSAPAGSLRQVAAQVASMEIGEALHRLLSSGVTSSEVFSLVIQRRTFDHRRQKHQSLTIDEAERAVTLVNAVVVADRVFGAPEKARRWLRHPNPHFDGEPPITRLRSMLGAREVEEELVRIDEGYFA